LKAYQLHLLVVGLVILVATIAMVTYWSGKQTPSSVQPEPSQPVTCTTNAKLCLDGSYVARIPPTCDFVPCPTITQPTPITDISNWKMYTNTEYGFEFKYSNNMKLTVNTPSYISLEFITHEPDSEILVKTYKSNLGLKTINEPTSPYSELEKESLFVGTNQAIKLSYYWIIEGVQRKNKNVEYFMKNQDNFVEIAFISGFALEENKNAYLDELKIFDQILSTFKFIDQAN